ncbi:MAG TPA: flagellar assembly protein FliW [Phycisphaerae bacterium]|nr:flagellar assembly protein FliW [Phycisphaerae bacterium]HOI54775.1 flagellar assembly protein FliW [Phycisphaerae bacterium]
MKVVTTRFGELDIDDRQVIDFPLGILGFPEFKRWILLQASPESVFFWLQSADAPDLAFILVQPHLFFKDYRVRAQDEELKAIGLDDSDAGEVFVICNRVSDAVTVNLQGPLVFNAATRRARQVVLCDRHLTTRHELCKLGKEACLTAAAV